MSSAARAALTSLLMLVAGLMAVTGSTTTAAAAYADASADGRIAFVRANQIYSMNRWGGDVVQLTSRGRSFQPEWSPDGRRIAFIREVDGRRDVWVMSANGRYERAVTTSGDVTSAGATWSSDGRVLAYATTQLMTIRSTAPYGVATPVTGYQTGGFCDEGAVETRDPVQVDRFLAWSPDGTRIAVRHHDDCYFDDRMDHYVVATGEQQQYAASGGDCCGYYDWSELFWGPGNQFGYTERNLGEFGDDSDAPSFIVYPGFRSVAGDTSGAPSPSGTFLALTNTASGVAMVVRARADGTGRVDLTRGYQPDWQVRRG